MWEVGGAGRPANSTIVRLIDEVLQLAYTRYRFANSQVSPVLTPNVATATVRIVVCKGRIMVPPDPEALKRLWASRKIYAILTLF